MSNHRECRVIEPRPDEWFYALEVESFGDEEDESDWTDTAAVHGPFPTEDAAWEHLLFKYGNPGGARITRYEADVELDGSTIQLLGRATK